jgi:hypothetical protein
VEFEKKSGGKISYSYTPLGEIMENIYPLLGKNGLAVRHEIVKEGSQDSIVAVLTHETYKRSYFSTRIDKTVDILDGIKPGEAVEIQGNDILHEQVEGELRSGPVKIFQAAEMKDTGAAITYARRYSLTMLLGIASEEDTDAKLFLESAKAAMDFAFTKAEGGIDGAKTSAELDKAISVLKKDLKMVEEGKAGALGLTKEQYQNLIKKAEEKKVTIGNEKPNEA